MQYENDYLGGIFKFFKSFLIKWKAVIIIGYITGFLSYMFVLTNKLINWDEIFYSFSKGCSYETGRWGLDILDKLFPNYSMPWLWGCLSITFIIIASILIIKLFDIKSSVLQCILTGIVVSFPSMISAFSYMFTSVTYALGFLMCVLSLYLTVSGKKINTIISFLLLVLSFSIYQSFISVIASFCVLIVIKKLLEKDTTAKSCIITGLKLIGFIFAAAVVYMAITLLVYKFTDTSLDLMISRTDNPEESASLAERIINIAKYFVGFFVNGTAGIIPNALSAVCHIIAMLAVVVLAVVWIKGQKNKGKGALLIVLILLLPAAINSIILISTGVHTLMVYGFVSTYILSVMLVENSDFKTKSLKFTAKQLIPALLILITISNIYTANLVYLRMYYENSNINSFFTGLSTRIEECEGFSEGDRVALCGESNELFYNMDNKFNKYSISGTNDLNPNIYSRNDYIKYFIGKDYDYLSRGEIIELYNSNDEIMNMPNYPYDGSVKKIDNIIVVKLSDKLQKLN